MSPLPRSVRPPMPPAAVRHEDCWAKTTASGQPGISVAQHCRTAGIVAEQLARQWPTWLAETLCIRSGVVLAATHDVGKVSPGFQAKCSAWLQRHGLTGTTWLGQEADHAKVSQKVLQDILSADNLRFWAAIVGAHHGRLKDDHLSTLADGGEAWTAERRRLVGELVQEFGQLPDQPPPSHDSAMLWFNAGLITVADWLASDERTFPPSEALDTLGIRQRAEAQLSQIGFRPVSCAPGRAFGDLFPFPEPNALQARLAESVHSPGVYVVEAPMGSGKTEAALIAAYNLLTSGQATGIYFALPTQVTSNRIHIRVAEFIDRLSPGAGTRLIHGGSWLMEKTDEPLAVSSNDETSDHAGRDWFASSRRALLAPFGVGTIDQALLGVVAAKHFFVRQFALAGKVVILDEVHSYDLYTGTLLELLVARLRDLGATVIILSATLTAARRQDLLGLKEDADLALAADYPLLSVNGPDGFLQQPVTPDEPKIIRIRFNPAFALVDAVLERADRGECVLWIRNTVQDAQETYRNLCGQNQVGGPEIALLHARFPQFRRAQLENDWLERLGKDENHSKRPSNGCVLVSTQVAEQSVDIDADLLVSDLAPTDMLLQRIGRLWRHPRPRPAGCVPEVWIAATALDMDGFNTATAREIKAAFGRSAKVYSPYVLLRTFALWHGRTTLVLPADIRPLLEATYADHTGEPPAWGALSEELRKRKKELCTAAFANSSPWQVEMEDDEGIQTRWNSYPTVPVLPMTHVRSWDAKTGAQFELLNGDQCQLRPHEFSVAAARSIHRNLVRVPRWFVAKHLGSIPTWLGQYVASEALPCRLVEGRLVVLRSGDDSGLTYRDDLGVVIPTRTVQSSARPAGEDDSESYD
ncbi:MAG: CRISPR-associated helicase Cas3' [Acidobacteria bacterium]|nr:CRISPR-associated helicase Cas3' [Acidobacteriota bacterium]